MREERIVIRGEIRPSLVMRSRAAQSNLLPLEFPYHSLAPTRLLQIGNLSLPYRGQEGARKMSSELSHPITTLGTLGSVSGWNQTLGPVLPLQSPPVPANLCVYK